MAQTHKDSDAREWYKALAEKAARMKAAGQSEIAGGEPSLAEWRAGGVGVRQLSPDEHGVLRISIGGGETPVPLDYCIFRGDHSACVDLLRKALVALEAGGDD